MEAGPKSPKALELSIINYNLWHGLGQGYFKRKELEPPGRLDRRFQHQLNLLKEAQPDILFLQELNPVSSRAKTIAKALNMDFVFQETNCGVSFFGFGVPVNLSMGIAILARPPLKIQKILGRKLSGPPGFCNPILSFQYAEFRYGLFALAFHPEYGSFLLAAAHLHHGPEWSEKLKAQIASFKASNTLTASQTEQLQEAVENSNQRRMKEVKALFLQIQELQEYYKGLPLILAGDFNATAASPVYKRIIQHHKLQDSMGANSLLPYTWDPLNNAENHSYTGAFGVSVPVFGSKAVEDFFKEYDRRRRRIDYVFLSDDFEVLSHSLFANTKSPGGLIGSDHFGLKVRMKTKGQEPQNPSALKDPAKEGGGDSSGEKEAPGS